MLRVIVFTALAWSLGVSCAQADEYGSGTGFYISSDGYMATNFHVVRGAVEIKVQDSHGNLYDAEFIQADAANDVAIIRVAHASFPALAVRSSSGVQKGAKMFTIGFPNHQMQGDEAKLTEGIISSLSGMDREPNNFQISVAIQPGNSGGPLIDASGAVVGITASKLGLVAGLKAMGTVPENVNYAIKSNYLLELIATVPGLTEKLRKPSANTSRTLAAVAGEAEHSVAMILIRRPDEATNQPAQQAPAPDGKPKYLIDAATVQLVQQGRQFYEQKNYGEAVLRFGKAADLGNPEAQFQLGAMYDSGLGVPQNVTQAAEWFRKSAQQGYARGQMALGYAYMAGRGIARDYAQAMIWSRKAADQGNADAQCLIGEMLRFGWGVEKNYAFAAGWFRKSALQGNLKAAGQLGSLYFSGLGVARDYQEAMQWSSKAANKGDALGQLTVGRMYAQGNGVPRDADTGATWVHKAADQGYDEALIQLGDFYLLGTGVGKNNEEALKWFYKAADKGSLAGQNNVGFMYENGYGVPASAATAFSWYRKAAEGNYALAQANVGNLYRDGRGVAADYAEAFKWYSKAADSGSPNGQFGLGKLYEKGWGVEMSTEEARNWYGKAAGQGYAKAIAALRELDNAH